MNLDEVAQKIYEERYVDPKHPEMAAYMRDNMIRAVVQRGLELTIGDLPVEVLVTLVVARQHRKDAHAKVVAWMKAEGARGELVQAGQAPDWPTYEATEEAWNAALGKLDAWIDRKEHP